MKLRIVELENGLGEKSYRVQYKKWYIPFWRDLIIDHAMGWHYLEFDTVKQAEESVRRIEIKRRMEQRFFKRVVKKLFTE